MITKTNNISFNKMREILQSSYVENNEFMMVTNHEELKDFDISLLFDETNENRKELINLINDECSNNVWFFFREILPKLSNSIDDNLYNLAEMSRYRLSITSMIMIYLYSQNKNFAVQKIFENHSQDKRIVDIATETLSLLALYELIFKSTEPGKLLFTDETYSNSMWEIINSYYCNIMSVASKGIIQIYDIIESSDITEKSLKFFNIGLDLNNGSIQLLNEITNGKKNFYGIIDHIYDYDDIMITRIKCNQSEYVNDLRYIMKDFISNNFSFRMIKSAYHNKLPSTETYKDKYHFDRIFDNQGPIPHNDNMIIVI